MHHEPLTQFNCQKTPFALGEPAVLPGDTVTTPAFEVAAVIESSD
ncbi:hypothetical protein [Fuerstiella marisgermanici]|nr:hypothetical protein [Fuerstiella marisgermanici]